MCCGKDVKAESRLVICEICLKAEEREDAFFVGGLYYHQDCWRAYSAPVIARNRDRYFPDLPEPPLEFDS